MKLLFSLLVVVPFLFFSARSYNEKSSSAGSVKEVAHEITLTPCEPSTAFPNASIDKLEVNTNDSTQFKFTLSNYTLGTQTPDAGSKVCANSAKGQHIHYIMDNAPYEAWYLPSFYKKIPVGEHIIMCFLSRSYHESIKTKKAFKLMKFVKSENGKTSVQYGEYKTPMLFYSRPKGEYIGNDAQKILLDFYLVNTTLSETGNKVKAVIQGKEFMITDWKPFYIEGLHMGENTVELTLIDKNGNMIPGMYNKTERKIVLKEK